MINGIFKARGSALNSGNPLAAAAKIYVIPSRILREWVCREGSPLKKLGRNAVLSADARK
jgi:hypothetical protein